MSSNTKSTDQNGIAKAIHLTVLTPIKKVLDTQCLCVYVPTKSGVIGVLPDHKDLISEVGTGVLHYDHDNQSSFMTISGGIVEVSGNQVRLFVDVAESAASIDVARAKEALERAREKLQQPSQEAQKLAQEAEALALARIDTAMRHTCG
jgi:F-type H+-transporting ATPase subunit epsilon